MKKILFIFCTTIMVPLFGISCGMTTKEARQKCYLGQLGSYQFDTHKTIMGGNFSKDSARLSQLIITFNPDSTFHTNMIVPFLDDTLGYWDAGTCGFENWGMMRFEKYPHKIQFGACCTDDNEICIIGQYRENKEGTQNLWFKKMN